MAGDMWRYAVVTTKGLLLQGKVATGGTIQFTKAKTGSGTVDPVLLQSQTDVTDGKQEFAFSDESTVNTETGLATLVIVIDNDGLATGYDCYQVGVFATDPDDGEILYAIMQSENALPVPAESEMVGWIAEMNIGMQYGNAENVNITMNQAGMATKEQLYAYAAPAPFYAMLSGNSTNGYTIDKTFAEITTAFSEGRDMRLLEYGSSMYQYKLVRATASTAYFAYNGGDDAYVVKINSSNVVTKETFAFLGAGHEYSVTAHSDIRNNALEAMTMANNAQATADNALDKANSAVPKTRTVNDKELSGNVTLTASDVGAWSKEQITSGFGMNQLTDCNKPPALMCYLNGWSSNLLNKPFLNKNGILFTMWQYPNATGTLSGIVYQIAISEDGDVFCRTGDFSTGEFHNWSQKYLPLDGSVAMSGDFKMSKTYPELRLTNTSSGRSAILQAYPDYTEVGDYVNSSNYRMLRVKPASEDVADGVTIAQMNSGAWKNYKLYGEHNVTKGTTDLTAGSSPLADGCIHIVYE